MERETGAGERETGMGERKIERETGAGEREIGRETGVGERERERERERDREEREGVTGEKEKKLQTQKNSWNFILSCFTPQNGVKHDSVIVARHKCRATIHCRASIRLPVIITLSASANHCLYYDIVL